MRKLISFINMTLDGFCDHTAVIADDELHEHANELFRSADTLLFGRKTYHLMESSWPPMVKKPTGNKPMDEFAVLIDNIAKIVFSKTLKTVEWENTRLARRSLKEEVLELKKQPGKNMIVGSPSVLIELMKLNLVDEYQFCVQPIVLGINLKILKTKPFGSGAVTLCYMPADKKIQN